MSEYIYCDRTKFCDAKKRCPLSTHIKLMIKQRYGDNFICPKNLFKIKEVKLR